MPKFSPVVPRRRRISSSLAVLALAVLTAAGCDSSTGNDDSIASLSLNPPTPVLNVGSVQQLVATPTTSSGKILEGRTASWNSSNPAVASVDGNGLVTALAGGTTTVSATVGGVSADAAVTVWFPVGTITVAPAAGGSATIRQEGAQQLTVTLLDSQGAAVTGRQMVWTSSNPSVAVVSPTGRVSALGVDGTTTITATALVGSAEGTLLMTVSGSPEVATVTTTGPAFMGTGSTVQFTAEAAAGSGTVIDDAVITWASSDDAIATVDATGNVTAVAAGEAVITATAEGVDGVANAVVFTSLVSGPAVVIPQIDDNTWQDFAISVPSGQASLSIAVSADAGDADIHLFAPGRTPGPLEGGTFTNFTCRPWLVGSTESCLIEDPAAGLWRLRVYAFEGEGNIENLNVTTTITAP